VRRIDLVSVLLAVAVPLAAQDPAQSSPRPGAGMDGAFAAVSVALDSHGQTLDCRFFRAEGDGLRPTVLLVPGWPGNPEDVLGLGARLSGRGINALMVMPRGMHGSGGTFTFAGSLEDIGVAWRWLHSDAAAERFGIDRARVTLGGYSWGGGMALAYAATDPDVRAVFSIAGTDHGEFIRLMQQNPDMDRQVRAMWAKALAPDGPVRGDADFVYDEMVQGQRTYGLRENAAALADRRILMVGGWDDRNITIEHLLLPVYRALKANGADDVTFVAYQDGHGFSRVRARLAADIVTWLTGEPQR
jgi:dienelactone hydrolase